MRLRLPSSSHSSVVSQNGTVIGLHNAMTHPLFSFLSRARAYPSVTREVLNVIYHLCRFPLAALRGLGNAPTRLLHCVFIFIILSELILSIMSGVTSHLALQAHTVARNVRSITLAICALPVPFKDVLCTGISNELPSLPDPNAVHPLPWYPFLINEDIHGPAVDLAICKAANATSIVLALVCASDLTQRHELSDKLKDFLQRASASELSTGSHLALVKNVIDE